MCFNYHGWWLSAATDEMSCTALQVHPICATAHTTLPVPLDCSNTYIICNEWRYIFICACVCQCSPIINNNIICTNPKTMTLSACGRGSSGYVVVCPLPTPPENHGGRWTATTQWHPSHIIRLKKAKQNYS